MVIVLVDSLVRGPVALITSSEPLSIVKVPVVSVKGISSVTVTDPSMMISSEPIGSTSSLQLSGSDQTSAAPSPSHEIIQVSTGWIPETEPIITPVQSLFIVPEALPMVPDVLSMVPELLMVPPLLLMVPWLMMPSPAGLFNIVMVLELLMILKELMMMPVLMPVFDIVMMPGAELVMLLPLKMPVPPVFDIVMVPELEMKLLLVMPLPAEF